MGLKIKLYRKGTGLIGYLRPRSEVFRVWVVIEGLSRAATPSLTSLEEWRDLSRDVPRRSARAFMSTKNTSTRIKTRMAQESLGRDRQCA